MCRLLASPTSSKNGDSYKEMRCSEVRRISRLLAPPLHQVKTATCKNETKRGEAERGTHQRSRLPACNHLGLWPWGEHLTWLLLTVRRRGREHFLKAEESALLNPNKEENHRRVLEGCRVSGKSCWMADFIWLPVLVRIGSFCCWWQWDKRAYSY